jgi:glycine cleavage system H protein
VGAKAEKGVAFGSVESVKAVSEIFSPVSGDVVAINEELANAPEKLNEDPHGNAWLVRIKLSDPGETSGLMTAAEYQSYAGGSEV